MPATAATVSSRHRIAAFVVWFLVVFNVLFPKGGFKIGDVPYTWGYLFLGATLVPLAIIRFAGAKLRMRKNTFLAVASLVPFQILVIYSFRAFGVSSFGLLATETVSFFVLPFAFFLVYPAFLDRIDGAKLASLFRFCILATALFGIFLFFYYTLTGNLVEIPFVTVNSGDYGQLENTKHINRGAFLKLISTYNNGNLYGICIIILLPLYNCLEPRTWKRVAVKIALVLTLSRSVWMGLVFEQLLSMVRLGWAAAQTFPRVALGPAFRKLLILLGTLASVLIGVAFVGGISFLFDAGLGGRSGYFSDSFEHLHFLPEGMTSGFPEINYLGALDSYGVSGLFCFTLIFVMPILLILANRSLLRSPIRRAACKGLVLYMIVSAADGALLLIPVLAFYWFAYMIFLEGWPGGLEMLPVNPPSQPGFLSSAAVFRDPAPQEPV
jgi:hypothetical protein